MVRDIQRSISPRTSCLAASSIPKSAQKAGLTSVTNLRKSRSSNVIASELKEKVNSKAVVYPSNEYHDSLVSDKDVNIQKECINLLRSKQYRSCEMLTMFHISTLKGNDENTLKLKATANEILGDSIMYQDQPSRALSYFQKAANNVRSALPPLKRRIGNVLHVVSASEANLKLKESKCLSKMGNTIEASSLLESSVPISHPLRTFAISMELGNLYMANGRSADAKRSFMDALSRNPYALEAVEKLVVLNAERSEVMRVLNTALKKDQNQNENQVPSNGLTNDFDLPISDLVTAYFYSHRSTQSHQLNALNQWKKLHSEYPQNLHVLLQMALLQTRNPALEPSPNAAKKTFEKIRAIDDKFIEGMDRYASILCQLNNVTELGQLAQEFLSNNDDRAESWSTLSLYHEACGNKDDALEAIDKALIIDSRNAFCYYLRGRILQSQHQPDIAAVSFFRANEIEKDLSHYEGMVTSVLAAKRYKEAVAVAKEAMNYAPRDCRSLTLVGLALSKAAMSSSRDSDVGKERATKALRKAISLDPFAMNPLLALVDLYIADSNFEECERILIEAIDLGDGAFLTPHTSVGNSRQAILQRKLADVYAGSGKFVDALTHYHRALSLHPDCPDAQRGIEQMEKAMGGLDASVDEDDRANYSY